MGYLKKTKIDGLEKSYIHKLIKKAVGLGII
jgi:hypothetical protein